MPLTRLTPQNVTRLPPLGKRTYYQDEVMPGLSLAVAASGIRSWYVTYRQKRMSLGRLEYLTLADARDAARQVLADVAKGQDPHTDQLLRKRGIQGVRTVLELCERFMEHAAMRPSTRAEWKRIIAKDIKATVGPKLAMDLRRGDVRQMEAVLAKRSAWAAVHAHAVLSRCYSWGVDQELVPGSPFVAMAKPPHPQRKTRVLAPAELRSILLALARFEGPHKAVALLLILTMTRLSMVLGARVSDFEGLEGEAPTWTVPGERKGTKRNHRLVDPPPHVVPLSAPAVAVVRARLRAIPPGGALLFPRVKRRRAGAPPVQDTMWWSVKFAAALRTEAQKVHRAPMPDWTIHSLRHAAATLVREHLRVSREVVALLLGHTLREGGAVTGIYDRAQLMDERRAALVAWADWLERLAAGEPGRVLPMAR